MFKSLKCKLAQLVEGRTTVFVSAFFLVGNILHLCHRLDGTYITFMATLMGFVVGHSIKEDYFAKPATPADPAASTDPATPATPVGGANAA